jgi:aminopeptidase YwaD
MRTALLTALFLCGCATERAGEAGSTSGREAVAATDRARAEVAWLSHPARSGRGVGTPGGAAAVDWLAERMREAGVAPAGMEGYLQPFDAPFRATLRDGNRLVVAGVQVALEDGWQPFTFSEDGSVASGLVWAGYGITAPELRHDDYAGLDVKGKIVLVAADFPNEKDPASPFRDPVHYRYGEWRYKVMNARDHGAAAVLAVRDDWNHPGDDRLPPWRGTVSSRAGIVAGRVTLAALRKAGLDAAALAAGGAGRALDVPAAIAVSIEQERARTANVVGFVPGADPTLANECVVVGAHHDHLGLGGETSLAPEQTGVVHPGADDNASGVAGLLAIARALVAGPPPRRPVLLVSFGAEELGLLGSSELVRAPPAWCPADRMALMVNLDMIGRPRDGKVYVEGFATAQGLRELVEAAASRAPALPVRPAFGSGDGYGPSDHTSFYAKGIPVLFFFTGPHADYHRPSDTAEKVDAAGLVAVARLAERVVRAAADAPHRLEVVRAPGAPPSRDGRGRGYGAYLGTIPDFAERKEPGVALTGVRPGSPAEKAGIGAGDVVVRMGDRPVRNLEDFVFVLRGHRAGDEVEIELLRGGEKKVVKVTLEERK